MQEAMGLSRGLLTMSMMYGHHYELALHGLARFPDRLRAVIAPWSGITDRELAILTKAGVVGARFAWRFGHGARHAHGPSHPRAWLGGELPRP